MAQEFLNHTSTREQIVSLYRDKGNIDIAEFETSARSFDELCRDLKNRELILFWEERVGRIICFSHSVALLLETPQGYVVEVGRQFYDRPPIQEKKPWTLSGRHRRNEAPLTSLKREYWEEMKGRIDERQLTYPSLIPEPTLRESRVYPRTLSAVIVQRHALKVQKPLNMNLIRDDNVTVFLEIFSTVPTEALEKYWESIRYYESVFGKAGYN